MERVLYILRAVPGAGKSTLAETLSPYICCADDYHTDAEGNYNWKAENQGKAHEYSRQLCKDYMIAGKGKIVVANTNTSEREMRPYANLAKTYGYTVFYLVVENRHGGTDSHNVPEETKAKMDERIRKNLKLR